MNILIKHTLLKELREQRTIPLEEMPRKLGISLEDYQRYEDQDLEVDIDFASKLANIFKKNWSVFLLDSAPKEILIPRDNRTTENKTPSLHEKTIAAVEDANYMFEFVKDLGSHKGLSIPKYDDIKDLTPEELGDRIRKISNIDQKDQEKFYSASDAFKKWRSFIEDDMGIFVSQYPLDPEDKIKAFSLSDHDRAVIVLNTNDIWPSRIFSLFHELCHILRRNSGICDLHSSLSSDVEVFCNSFAAAFLLPLSVVSSYITSKGENIIISDIEAHVKVLSSHFKVSQLVVYRRFATLGLITDSQYSNIHNKTVSQFVVTPKKIEEESTGGPNYYTIRRLRNGVGYSNAILGAYSGGEITAFETSRALGISVKNINEYRSRTA